VTLTLELPDLVALVGLDDPRGAVLELRGQAPLEHVGRLDQVVVDRDDRVPDLAGLRLGQEQRGIEIDRRHDSIMARPAGNAQRVAVPWNAAPPSPAVGSETQPKTTRGVTA